MARIPYPVHMVRTQHDSALLSMISRRPFQRRAMDFSAHGRKAAWLSSLARPLGLREARFLFLLGRELALYCLRRYVRRVRCFELGRGQPRVAGCDASLRTFFASVNPTALSARFEALFRELA